MKNVRIACFCDSVSLQDFYNAYKETYLCQSSGILISSKLDLLVSPEKEIIENENPDLIIGRGKELPTIPDKNLELFILTKDPVRESEVENLRGKIKSWCVENKVACLVVSSNKTKDFITSGFIGFYMPGGNLFEKEFFVSGKILDIPVDFIRGIRGEGCRENKCTSVSNIPINIYPFGEDILNFNHSVKGLILRMLDYKGKDTNLIIGVSGGSDSTLALLKCVKAVDLLGGDRKNIIGVTMPGFGSSERTKDNSFNLMKNLGISTFVVDIRDTVEKHLIDIGCSIKNEDLVFENAQARMRTMILFNLSNKYGGIVVGTGDMSENFLGWCTFGGDHLSGYNVNAGTPKTEVLRTLRDYDFSEYGVEVMEIIKDIVDTPISPELLSNGLDNQKSEDIVGPYILVDYFMYLFLTYKLPLDKIIEAGVESFKDKYSEDFIKERFNVFYKRFENSEFKRRCSPDGADNIQGVYW